MSSEFEIDIHFDKLACAACGSKDTVEGRMTDGFDPRFFPNGKRISLGYKFRTIVCLTCGHVGGNMRREEVERLRLDIR